MDDPSLEAAAASPQASRSGSAAGDPAAVRLARGLGMLLGRSFFPFMALAILAGSLLWGPWISLALAVLAWNVVMRTV